MIKVYLQILALRVYKHIACSLRLLMIADIPYSRSC